MNTYKKTINKPARALNFAAVNVLYIFLMAILASGCAKNVLEKDIAKSAQIEGLRLPVMTDFTVSSMSYHSGEDLHTGLNGRKQNSYEPQSGIPNASSYVYKDGPGLISPQSNDLYFFQRYKSRMFTVADQAMSLNIYPGAILDGRSIEGAFNPRMLQGISGNIRPVTISTSMPVSGSAVARTSLPRPSAERALLNTALTDLENINPGGIGAASLQLELDSFKVYEELKTLYGYNKDVGVFLVNANTTQQGENHKITATSALKIKFFQENFTIDLDVPNSYNELFDPTGLDMNSVTGGVTPVYVKSVTYGRMGIMVIESSYSSTKVYNAIYKQLGILQNLIGIDRNLTDEEKTIINSADIKIKYTGIGQDADGTIKVNGLAGFIDIMQANKTYSKESPGVPVAFQLAYLNNDHANVEAPFQINYGPYDKPYAKIQYANETITYHPSGYINFRNTDMYVSFFHDRGRNSVYNDVPAFIPFVYEWTTNSTSYTNYVPTYGTKKQLVEFAVTNGASRYFAGNVRLYYYIKYGSTDANTSKDEHSYRLLPNNYFLLAD